MMNSNNQLPWASHIRFVLELSLAIESGISAYLLEFRAEL
ncbi:hypothetical protein 3S11_25 [uncultured Caudovirales phage]|uniref:Uncharacterized protein n=1 Tax=uncultured Caudovirales phage TaxID=2100421 RepID=A0A2H4J5N6_9CAUD|nr:hypothetical protein 3S11_25 [uncultured Caudovirales phage]